MTAPLSAQTAVEGRYLLDAPLDGWGLGETWQCRDKNFRNRPVALKFLPAERADRLAEAAQELRAQRALKHPCVLPVINQGTHAGRAWVAYDGFDGVPLTRLVDEQRRARGMLDAAAARELFAKVLDAVAAGHEAAAPVLHGCLQPACVLVKGPAVKVVDFGLHPFAPPGALGPFRAPELAAEGAAPTLASDVYALGATLADLLLPQQGAGDPRRALESLLAALGRDGAQAGRMQRNDVALSLWDAIARATRRDPAARWDDVSALRAALDAAWDAAPLAPARASAPPGLPPAPAFAQPPAPVAAMPVPAGPAFSATMPPLAAPLPPPVAPAPAAAFLRAPTMPPVPAPRPPAPVAAWDAPPPSYPSTPPGDAWSTARPPLQRAVEPALAAAWDPPLPAAVPVPPPWPAGPSAPLTAGPLVAGARAARDDEWDEETRAADPSRASGVPAMARPRAVQESTMALDVEALAGGLPPLPTESTMALDVEALAAAAAPLPPPPRASRPSQTAQLDDDWKDSVVVLDTTSGNTELASGLGAPDDDDEEPYEPGARTRMAPAPAEVMETMETLQPRRNLAVEAYLASAHPIPTAERTMALDTETVPDPAFATVPAPMGRPPTMAPLAPQPPAPMGGGPMYGLPPAQRPSASPARGFQPPPGAAPSKAPIVAAAVTAVLLVGGALAFVLLR